MTLDNFLKVLTPYSYLEIIVVTKDNSISIEGYKISVISELIEHDFSSLEDYEIYSIDLVKGYCIREDGDDRKEISSIRLIVKESY